MWRATYPYPKTQHENQILTSDEMGSSNSSNRNIVEKSNKNTERTLHGMHIFVQQKRQ